VSFSPNSSNLTEEEKKNLYNNIVLPWFAGKIVILGIRSHAPTTNTLGGNSSLVDMRYVEIVSYLKKYGIPGALLKLQGSGETDSFRNGTNCGVVTSEVDPSLVEQNKKEREQCRIDAKPIDNNKKP
jgi:hypothetical protein